MHAQLHMFMHGSIRRSEKKLGKIKSGGQVHAWESDLMHINSLITSTC
jgi:hypothetical protein